MKLEKVAASHGANVSSSDFVKSSKKNDHSNPQQGTGGTMKILQEKQDRGRQNKNDRNPISAKSDAPSQSNYCEDKRKLFVGGLPTDITDPEFRYFFSQFGELQESVVMFDRGTRRSRGFGFVTYVNPDIPRSILKIGNRGDGIGRLVMRGKTCEVKAAAPRGQAPTRGGKAYRTNRDSPRNRHQVQAHQVPSFGHNEQFSVMYQNDNYSIPYPQGVYSAALGVPVYVPPIYHHPMSHLSHSQPHGSIPLNVDYNLSDSRFTGEPYFFGSPLAAPPSERFAFPNAFYPTPQIPAHCQQQDYAFVPYISDHTQSALPAMEMTSMTHSVEPSIQAKEEVHVNNEGVLEVEKE